MESTITWHAMTNLNIATIDARVDEDFDVLARRILRDLKGRKLYGPNLMYRGVNVSNDGIKKIARYGTDRNPDDAKRVISNAVYESLPVLREIKKLDDELGFGEDHFRKGLIEESDPTLIWALPKEGLAICIEDFAFDGDEKPIILVYKPKFLVHGIHGHMWEGKGVPELIRRFGREELVEDGLYRFREGIKPIDAAVIGYVLQKPNR